MTLDPDVVADFIIERHSEQLVTSCVRATYPALCISMLDVFDWNPSLAQSLLKSEHPMTTLNEGLSKALSRTHPEREFNSDHNVMVRLHSFPLCLHGNGLPTNAEPDTLVQFAGVVVRSGPVRMRETFKPYQCASCAQITRLPADERQYGAIPRPGVCNQRLEDGTKCRGTMSPLVGDLGMARKDNRHEDVQEIRVQGKERGGTVPRSMTVLLKGELVDSGGRVGENVVVCGRTCIRWKNTKVGERVYAETIVIASSICSVLNNPQRMPKVTPNSSRNRPELSTEERDRLVRMFCPEIKGMFPVKLAMLLTTIGGSSTSPPAETTLSMAIDATAARRHGHLLLVGDPGTAKSVLLRAAHKLVRRAVFISGSATTGAGLTVTAHRDSHGWSLEPGALIMADHSICCIDEFAAIKLSDRTALHEALEQQSVSVAKAGVVCRLPTRCSVLAACNTRDRYDGDLPITANLAIASPLLSRFDLIMVLLDRQSPEFDRQLADHVLYGKPADENGNVDNAELASHINMVRDSYVQMTEKPRSLLSKYYQKQRQQDLRDTARTTIRLLESLVRLAEAHAKLCKSDTVRDVDAAVAIRLMDLSLTTRSSMSDQDALHKDTLLDGELTDYLVGLEQQLE